MHTVFIDGQAGTTGLEIAERLAARQDIDLLAIDAQHRKDTQARRELMRQADVSIWCLPDAAAAAASEGADTDCRILDASSVHRTNAAWTYGLPEIGGAQRDAIRTATRVSNPGCYPQGFILWTRALIQAQLLPIDLPLSINAVSGYSGGGRQMIENYQSFSPEQAERWNTRSYGLTLQHKHLPEMHAFSGCTHAPVFAPSVANYLQGMLTQIPLHLSQLPKLGDPQQLVDTAQAHYANDPLVHVHPLQAIDAVEEGYLNATACNGTDRIELMVFASTEHALLVARYDNLGKGAAGCAVQNLNLMLATEETAGLRL